MSDSMKEVRIGESHDCDKVHPKMNHLEWVAQNKDAANQDKDPVGAQHEEVLVEGKDDEPRTQVGTKHKIKPQYNTKTHKLITTPSGNVKVVPKSTPGMEAEETEWQKSKRLDREAQKRSEKQHDEREARYQRQKERDALVKAVAKSPKQQALKKKQDAAKNEEVGVEEGAGYTGGVRPQKPPHMRAGQSWKKIALIKKERERKKALHKANVAYDTAKQASKMKYMKKAEEVEVDEGDPGLAALRALRARRKKKGTPNLDASRAASKAKREKDNPKNFRTPQQAHHDKGHGWDRFEEVEEARGLGGWKGSGIEKMPPVDKKTGKYVTGKTKIQRLPKKEEVEVDEQEMMQLKHKKSGQVMRMAKKVYQKQAHIQRERGWVPDSKQPHMRGGSALQHSYEAEGDTELQEMDFKVKIKGLPVFYVPGRSVGEIRAHMRKNLKRPQDVEWVERSTVAQKKKDFRLRAQDKDSG